ncbi:hypothetical protein E2542_SST00587 [Spatholobus suberectus]|nr:hypothetical protein E2542_SST00587 [Spatholobus suberectus]
MRLSMPFQDNLVDWINGLNTLIIVPSFDRSVSAKVTFAKYLSSLNTKFGCECCMFEVTLDKYSFERSMF